MTKILHQQRKCSFTTSGINQLVYLTSLLTEAAVFNPILKKKQKTSKRQKLLLTNTAALLPLIAPYESHELLELLWFLSLVMGFRTMVEDVLMFNDMSSYA